MRGLNLFHYSVKSIKDSLITAINHYINRSDWIFYIPIWRKNLFQKFLSTMKFQFLSLIPFNMSCLKMHRYRFKKIKVYLFILMAFQFSTHCKKLEMGSDSAQAYFWPAVNKRPTRVLSDPTQRDFFWHIGKKLKNLTFLGEIFQIQTQTINGWPDLTRSTIEIKIQVYSWPIS